MSETTRPQGLRVTHCPVNIAGIPWENVQALRRKGVDARLVVFNRGKLHPEADWSLDRRGPLPASWRSSSRPFARLAPQTDVFHFYFGLTLLPKSLQFPLLRAPGKKSVLHFLGSDIRGKTPESSRTASAPAPRSSAPTTRSAGCRRRTSSRRGSTCARSRRPAVGQPRARSSCTRRRTARRRARSYVIAACAELPVELEIVEGVPHREAFERYARADIIVDQLNAGWYGVFAIEAMALGKPVVTLPEPDAVERSAEGFGVAVPIVPATKETLVDALRPLVEQPALRRELGAASRAYVEQVHDIERVTDRLLALYAAL